MYFYEGKIDAAGIQLTPEADSLPAGPALTLSFADAAAKIETIIQLPEPDMVVIDLNDSTLSDDGVSQCVRGLTIPDYKTILPGLAEIPTFMAVAADPHPEAGGGITIYRLETIDPAVLEAALKDGAADVLDVSDINSLINPAIVTAVDDRGLYRDIHLKTRFNDDYVCHTKLTAEQLVAQGLPAPAPSA